MIARGSKFLDASGSLRLVLSETDQDIDLTKYTGSSEGFTMWQQIVDPLYYQRPFEERARIAANIYTYDDEWPSVVRKALSLGPLPPLACCCAGSSAEDLLRSVAKAMGRATYHAHIESLWWYTEDTKSTASCTDCCKVGGYANQ